MKIINFLRLNQLSNKYFSFITILLLLIFNFTFLTNSYFTSITALQHIYSIISLILGFIIITFLPGFVILRILKINEENNILNLLLVLGTSIFFSTILGLSINFLSIFFNDNLLLPITILIAYNLILLPLIILSSFKEKNSDNIYIEANLKQISILIFIPLISILGTYILNYLNINYLNIILIIIISALPFFYKYKQYHTLLIWVASISILLNVALVSNYLWSWDIHSQFYNASTVLQNHIWNYQLESDSNSLLTIVLLAPIYSFLTGLNLVWVYKIIYPLLFSFVPLGIYYLVKNQFKSYEIAYFSSFIFIFYYGFFKDMVDKQFIAEIFLILIFIVLLSQNNKLRNILIIPFIIMLPLTHYGVSYIFLIAFTLAICALFALKQKEKFSLTVLFFAAVMIISWHIYTGGGSVFNNIITIGSHISSNLGDIIAKPETRTGADYLSKQTPTIIWTIYKILNASILFFMGVGILKLCLSIFNRTEKFVVNQIYSFICIFLFGIIMFQIFANSSLGMDRGLQISLVVLSPLVVVGFLTIVNYLIKIIKRNKFNQNTGFYIFAVFLCVFFIFSSGLAHYIDGDDLPYSINLNKNPDWHVYSESEVAGMKWSKYYGTGTIGIINPWSAIKSRDGSLAMGYYLTDQIDTISPNSTRIENNYIFVGNTTVGSFKIGDSKINLRKMPVIHLFNESNIIYNSGEGTIFYLS